MRRAVLIKNGKTILNSEEGKSVSEFVDEFLRTKPGGLMVVEFSQGTIKCLRAENEEVVVLS